MGSTQSDCSTLRRIAAVFFSSSLSTKTLSLRLVAPLLREAVAAAEQDRSETTSEKETIGGTMLCIPEPPDTGER